jgi:hypothetical protein
MCTAKKPKAPKAEDTTPAVLMTARDGMGGNQESGTSGRKSLRIDLNNSATSSYGSSLVIPT